MNTTKINFYLFLIVSFFLALLLSVFPLPMECRWWRAEFVLLLVIYWVMLFPFSMSLVVLCLLGLFQDLLEGVPFGQHSLGMIVVSYITLFSYQRLRNFNLPKQMLAVMLMIAIAQLTDNWVQGMSGRPLAGVNFLFAAFSSALCWPILRYGMDYVCHRLRVSS